MENEMIERVARAMWEARSSIWGAVEPQTWESAILCENAVVVAYRGFARAAIAAMREPTDEQRTAYYELSHRTEFFFDAHWERAIDAILKSE